MPEKSTSTKLSSAKDQMISSVGESISQCANVATSHLHKAANTLSKNTIESASQTAIQASNQLQDVAKTTIRWLWWWGLAAVGVYGISTTLTKEGVQILKDVLTSSSSSQDKLLTSSAAAVGKTVPKSENEDDALTDYEECTRGSGDCF